MPQRSLRWTLPMVAGLAVPIGLYIIFILLGAFPYFQRHFMYAHSVHWFWDDLDRPEYWGFARNQVTPFYLNTADGETIYAWHMLPLPTYLRHEAKLQAAPAGFAQDFAATESFKILKNDPEARLVIYFHGNAGHIAQAIRPDSYHALTDTSRYHVLSLDYRGFGHSTGTPSEAGLILDGAAAVEWAMKEAGIPPSRIVILGQSLGTAVTSGVAEHFALQGIEFAGVILVAGFSNMPTLLTGYAAAGIVPVLSPLKRWPFIVEYLQAFIVDKWPSDQRVANLVRLTKTRLRLSFIHAKNDMEIPCTESDSLFMSAANATLKQGLDAEAFEEWKKERMTIRDDSTFVAIASANPNILVREELVPYGGHNHVMMSSPVTLAVMRSFGFAED